MGKTHKKNPSHFTHIQFQKTIHMKFLKEVLQECLPQKSTALSWMFMTNFMQLLQQSVSYINRHEIPR